ncbi:MAG: efflux RND transporter permease subunit [Rhodospirillales bacterium]|nr:efflux RND transporter permease subunit [Rhodospirillales bacterium]
MERMLCFRSMCFTPFPHLRRPVSGPSPSALFKPLAYTKTYAMAAASILAITLTPVLMGYFIRGRILPERRNPINRLLIAAYQPFIRALLKAPILMVIIAAVAGASMIYPHSRLGSEFMPELDEAISLYMPAPIRRCPIGKMQQVLQQTNKLISTIPEVRGRLTTRPGGPDTATDPAPLTIVETTIKLKPRDQWRRHDNGSPQAGTGRSGQVRASPTSGSCPSKIVSTCWRPASRRRWGSRSPAPTFIRSPTSVPASRSC